MVLAIKKPSLNLDVRGVRVIQKNPKTKDGSASKRSKGTDSKKCSCPFTLKGKVLSSKDEWMLLVACGVHNH